MYSLSEMMSATRRLRYFLIGLVPAVALILFPVPPAIQGMQNYLPLHSFLEMLAITVCVSIFALCQSVYNLQPSREIRWFAWMFLGVALFDFTHMISYPGMPDFVTPGGLEKAINFWLAARSLAAVSLFVVVARLLPDLTRFHRLVMPAFVVALVAVLHGIFLFEPHHIPDTFIEGQGLTSFKVNFEYVLILIYALTALLLIRENIRNPQQNTQFNTWFLADAALVMGLSEFMFTLYGSATDIFNIYGHFLKVAAYSLLFRGLFVQLVKQPYLTMIDFESERSAVFKALPDAILQLDLHGKVRSVLHNTQGFDALGLPLVPGQSLAACLGRGWDERLARAFEKARVGHAYTIEDPYIRPSSTGRAKVFILTVSYFVHVDAQFSGWLVVLRDVSDREFHKSEAVRLSSVLSNAPIPIALIDQSWRTGYVNDSYRERFGGFEAGFFPSFGFDLNEVESAIRQGESFECERTWTNESGADLIEHVYFLPTKKPDGSQTGTMVFIEDVTERRMAEARLQKLLRYDQLTGLPRLDLLAESFKASCEAPGQTGRTATLLRLNIDDFARINATYGHEEGDRIFQLMVENLRAALDPTVLLSRDQGQDLALLVIDMPRADVPALVSTVLKSVSTPISVGNETIRLTTCIGVAAYPDDGKTFEELRAATDAALRAAKEQGPGSWNTFSTELRERLARFMAVSAHLDEAMRNNELSLVFQPQMRSDGRACCGAEVLLRWDSAALGRVSPEEFIAVAEATGEIRGVGQWLFKETVVTLKRWLADGKTFPKLSINLSPADFEDAQTAVKFKEFAQQSQVDPGLLEIELTERMLVKKSDTAIATVQEFRKNGFGVALDDFGAGQTSLQYLLHFPVQILKIDRSLTTGVVCDTRSTAVVRSIVDLAHQLGMRVIAEGVETAEQQAIIADTNCDAIQGYYFSKPLTERQFFEFLKHVRCEPLGGEPRH